MFRILILASNNSVLSPMAEAYFRKYTDTEIEIYSAGIENNRIDPVAVTLLQEENIDTSVIKQYSLNDLKHIDFDFIITCDEESEVESHHLPSKPVKYHYDFQKLIPMELSKSKKEEVYRDVRDNIKRNIRNFIRTHFHSDKTE